MPKNDWNEYKRLVISKFEDDVLFKKEVLMKLGTLHTDVSNLKVKAAIAGGMAGMVGTGVLTVVLNMFK